MSQAIPPQIQAVLERKYYAIVEACKCRAGCQKCARTKRLYVDLATAQIPVKYWDYKLKDLEWDEIAAAKVQKYAKKLEEARTRGIGLFMWGHGGVGKSLGACLVLKEALKKGFTARFTTLSQTIAMSTDGLYDREAREAFQHEVLQVDFLVLDDIDKTYRSEKTRFLDSQTDAVFRQRANFNLPVIVTSNKPRSEVASVTDAQGEIDLYGIGLLELFAEHLIDIVFTKTISRRQAVNVQELEQFLGE